NQFVVIGQRGTELAELRKVSSITDGDTLVLTANLANPHTQFEQVTVLFGNQIKVYRASNVNGTQPADASFAELSTTTIDPDQASTTIVDSG
ncbi:hypothetical protein ABK046_46530, partial [Streptomyces caeruleatus]